MLELKTRKPILVYECQIFTKSRNEYLSLREVVQELQKSLKTLNLVSGSSFGNFLKNVLPLMKGVIAQNKALSSENMTKICKLEEKYQYENISHCRL